MPLWSAAEWLLWRLQDVVRHAHVLQVQTHSPTQQSPCSSRREPLELKSRCGISESNLRMHAGIAILLLKQSSRTCKWCVPWTWKMWEPTCIDQSDPPDSNIPTPSQSSPWCCTCIRRPYGHSIRRRWCFAPSVSKAHWFWLRINDTQAKLSCVTSETQWKPCCGWQTCACNVQLLSPAGVADWPKVLHARWPCLCFGHFSIRHPWLCNGDDVASIRIWVQLQTTSMSCGKAHCGNPFARYSGYAVLLCPSGATPQQRRQARRILFLTM